MSSKFNIKTNRTFTIIRKYGFLFTLLVAFGGLWEPKLGLLVIPVMIGLILLSFYKGRYWCGNICAHGSLFDSLILPLSLNNKIPKFFKYKIVSITFFSLFTYKIVSKFIKVFSIYGTLKFWDRMGLIFVTSYIMVTIVGGLLGLIISPRTWCNFCPMGVMQKISYSFGKKLGVTKITDEKISISNKALCHKCGKCSRVCPMQLSPYSDFSDDNQLDDVNCIRCSTCALNCPAGILTLSNEQSSKMINKHISIDGYENKENIVAKISNIKHFDNDISEYTFDFIEPQKVDYKAGQFILIKIQENPEMFRAYSISSYNENGKNVSVAIKDINGYGTNIITKNFKLGDKVILEGPMGHELVVDSSAKKVLLVGGGIGITPFLPIVKDLLRNSNALEEVKLLYGVNYEKEFIYREEFEELEKFNDKFEFIKVVAFDKNWKGNKGFVTDHMTNIDVSDYKVYMCGPMPMINASINKLTELGVNKNNINYESA